MTLAALSPAGGATLLLAALLGVAGCSGNKDATLRLEPADRPVIYNQRFTSAHYSVEQDGGYDVVLHNTPSSPKAQKGQPLLPSASSAPEQFMHLRVAWRPSVGAKANHPAATNSIVDWYIVDDSDPHHTQYLHYQGTGLVKIYADDQTAEFDIQPLSLTLRHQQGNLSDPLRSALISGQFEARRSSGRVRALLGQVQETMSAGVAASGAAEPAPAGAPPVEP